MANPTRPHKLLPFFLGVLVVCILGYTYWNSHENARFDNEQVTELNSGWMLQAPDGGESAPIELPARLEVNAQTPVMISYLLPDDLSMPVVLCFRSSQQQVRVLCDGEVVYSYGHDPSLYPFGKSPGSAWNLVRLPDASSGSEVSIELISPYRSYSGSLSTIYLGSKAALLFMLVREHLLSFMLTVLILICGISLVIFHIVFLRKSTAPPSVLYLGSFALLVSGWMFGESKMVQFFVGKPLFSLAFTFMCMLLLPVPIIRYIRCINTFRFKALCSRIIALLYLQMIVVFALQICNVVDLIEMLPVIHLLFFTITIILLVLLLYDKFRNRQQVQRTSFSLLVLLFFGVMETIVYYLPNSPFHTGVLLQLGMLLFILMQARVARNHALYIFRLSREATTDGLTGCQNRLAYSRRLQQLSLYSGLAAVVMDMNDLKNINDTMGHAAGDEAILLFSRSFKHVFNEFGDCYRIGGDEFVFISRIISEARLRELIFKFENLCVKQNAQLPYRLEAAIGYAIYDSAQDRRVSDLIRRADQAMYAHKKRMKQS